MVTFQCKRSGNFVSFTNEDDIRGLRQHEGYVEVIQTIVPIKPIIKVINDAPLFLQPIAKNPQRKHKPSAKH